MQFLVSTTSYCATVGSLGVEREGTHRNDRAVCRCETSGCADDEPTATDATTTTDPRVAFCEACEAMLDAQQEWTHEYLIRLTPTQRAENQANLNWGQQMAVFATCCPRFGYQPLNSGALRSAKAARPSLKSSVPATSSWA